MLKIFLSISLLYIMLFAKERVYVFAPLPTKNISQNIKEFLPLSYYMEKKYGVKIKYTHFKNYKDILEGFKAGKIDMAYLGPLPFVTLHKQYEYAQPIVIVKQKNSKDKYRCVLAKFKEDKLDFTKKLKIALTQPLSTCGYYMSSKLLKEKYNLDLSKQLYNYKMSHTNALLEVVKGRYDLAGAKEDIAKKFHSLGMEIVAKSELLPGFCIVVNTKTISKQTAKKIQDILLSIPEYKLLELGGIASRGFVKASIKDYDVLQVNIKIPKVGNFNED